MAIIDETLHKRGKMKLIINQPLHPVERHPPTIRPPQPPMFRPAVPTVPASAAAPRPSASVPRPQPRPVANGTSVPKPGGSAAVNGDGVNGKHHPVMKPPQSRPSVTGLSNPPLTAGPSRRPPSPVRLGEPLRKKLKEGIPVGASPCAVCGAYPAHPLKHCPTVMEGPQR